LIVCPPRGLALNDGNHASALSYFRETLIGSRDVGNGRYIAFAPAGFARVAAQRGQLVAAANLLGGADAMLDTLDGITKPFHRDEYDPTTARFPSITATLLAHLEVPELVEAWGIGRTWKLERLISDALAVES
jgi:hypothetical protein